MMPETMAQPARNFAGTENLPRSSTLVENFFPSTSAVICEPNFRPNAFLSCAETRTRPFESTREVKLAESERLRSAPPSAVKSPTVKPFTFHLIHLIVITLRKYINLCGKGAGRFQPVKYSLAFLAASAPAQNATTAIVPAT